MNEQAAHLVDRVLPHVPYRQWVLTLPGELARVVAFDADLATAVFGVFAEDLARWQRERANDRGLADPQTGSLLEIQRFADGARTAAGPGAQRPCTPSCPTGSSLQAPMGRARASSGRTRRAMRTWRTSSTASSSASHGSLTAGERGSNATQPTTRTTRTFCQHAPRSGRQSSCGSWARTKPMTGALLRRSLFAQKAPGYRTPCRGDGRVTRPQGARAPLPIPEPPAHSATQRGARGRQLP